MYHLRTEIEIDRPAAEVWRVFRDFASYGQWNPFVRELSGDVEEDGRIEVLLQPPGGKPMRFKPRVTEIAQGRRLVWLGHLMIPKLFDGEHYFEIEPIDDQRCRFVQGEHFGGVLVPFLRSMLDKQTRSGFEAMNQALKERAERA